jgi:hypothetical protein
MRLTHSIRVNIIDIKFGVCEQGVEENIWTKNRKEVKGGWRKLRDE